jgi:hypothetical protein
MIFMFNVVRRKWPRNIEPYIPFTFVINNMGAVLAPNGLLPGELRYRSKTVVPGQDPAKKLLDGKFSCAFGQALPGSRS